MRPSTVYQGPLSSVSGSTTAMAFIRFSYALPWTAMARNRTGMMVATVT